MRNPDSDDETRSFDREHADRQYKISKWQLGVTACSALAALVGLGFVWQGLQTTRNATVEANRAWIAARAPLFQLIPVKAGDRFSIAAPYDNIGRSPALNLSKYMEPIWVASPSGAVDVSEVKFPANNTCSRIAKDSNIGTVWPSVAGPNYAFSSNRTNNNDYVTENFFNKTQLLAFHGCYSYVTFEQVRFTAFCFVANFINPVQPTPNQPPTTIFVVCPGADQNFAD